MNPLIITYGNVYWSLCNLNVSNTPGDVRSYAGFIAYPLALLFVWSLSSGNVRSNWKKSVIVPLFKSGSRTSPTKCRLVSLTSVFFFQNKEEGCCGENLGVSVS